MKRQHWSRHTPTARSTALRGDRSSSICAAAPRAQRKHQDVLALRARIRAEVPYFPAPPALHERWCRVLLARCARIGAPRHAPRSPDRSRLGWLMGGALAGCAATVLAFVARHRGHRLARERGHRRQAVATHVRATLNNQLIEVASSDQHTVKPWLSARLDYSPPVRDFASEGFRSIGGTARNARQAARRHAGLSLSAAHDRRLRPARVGALRRSALRTLARLQRRARHGLGHGLARGIRRQRRRVDRVRAAARATIGGEIGIPQEI